MNLFLLASQYRAALVEELAYAWSPGKSFKDLKDSQSAHSRDTHILMLMASLSTVAKLL